MKNMTVDKKEICRLFKRRFPELYALSVEKKRKKLFKVLLIEVIVVACLALAYSGFAQRGITVTYIISGAIVCLAIPFFVKPYLLWLTPTRLLKIENTTLEDTLTINDMNTGKYRVMRSKREVRLKITALDGKGRIFEYSLSKLCADAFSKGDIIAVFSGFNIPVNLTYPPKKKRVCINCGGTQYESDDICVGCSLPMVKMEQKDEKIVI